MIDIAARMRELLPLLRRGVNGVVMDDVTPECEDEWSHDYAIVQDMYWDSYDFGHYFDEAQFRYDLGQFIFDHFKHGADEPVALHDMSKSWNHKWPAGTVVVVYREGSHQLEVYRAKEGPQS